VFGLLQNIEIYNIRRIIIVKKQETGRRGKMIKIIVRTGVIRIFLLSWRTGRTRRLSMRIMQQNISRGLFLS